VIREQNADLTPSILQAEATLPPFATSVDDRDPRSTLCSTHHTIPFFIFIHLPPSPAEIHDIPFCSLLLVVFGVGHFSTVLVNALEKESHVFWIHTGSDSMSQIGDPSSTTTKATLLRFTHSLDLSFDRIPT
jgi:hypothetical protein